MWTEKLGVEETRINKSYIESHGITFKSKGPKNNSVSS